MTIREILQVGNRTLRERSKKITRFNDAVRTLADDMVETMHEFNGVGLAAPQVGVLLRLIVVEMPDEESYPRPGERFIVCNPEVVQAGPMIEVAQEGCLSVAGYVGMVERPVEVIIRGQTLDGKKFRIKAQDFLARAFLHEMDHLNGILYIDRAEEGSVMTLEELERRREEEQMANGEEQIANGEEQIANGEEQIANNKA